MTLQRFTRDLIETAGQMCPCIAHDDVDAAEGLIDVIDQGCGVRWLADIGDKAFDPGRTNGRYGTVKLSFVAAANADATTPPARMAGFGRASCGMSSDPAP